MKILKNESDFGVFDWWKKVVKNNYANFEGRARRSEYWYFVLANIVILVPIMAIGAFFIAITEMEEFLPVLAGVAIFYNLLIFIPTIAVSVRRLHDTGKSGWFYLLNFIPLGSIILLIFYIQDSDLGTNKWGENPKEIEAKTS